MRIISGAARGRKLKEPQGFDIRPTSSMVKESIFNIIQFDIEGRRVLDLFAGTGQLGIEALSRGAAGAVFVDNSPQAVAAVRDNLSSTRLGDGARVTLGDSLGYLKDCAEKFDLIFIDPPYKSNLTENSLSAIYMFDILSAHGIIICKTDIDKTIAPPKPPYFTGKEYKYGRTKITVIQRE